MNEREERAQPYNDPIALNENESLYNQKIGPNHILMFQLLEFQKLLNIELIKNQNCIDSYLTLKRQEIVCKNGTSGGSSTSDGVRDINRDHSSYQTIINLQCKTVSNHKCTQPLNNVDPQKTRIKNPQIMGIKPSEQDSSYNPKDQQQQKQKFVGNSESKNVPKNISKAILIFVMKNEKELKKLMQDLKINKSQFMEEVASLKGKIHAIAQLRSLWLDSQNKHAKIFRIISNYYLRKYSLQHIFNSRVVEHAKHLKYRQRILSALRNPLLFTHMKQY